MELWHRHLGVYGICVEQGKLLVIRKQGGPYTNRFDLPGGSVEGGEPLADALRRELREETGLDIRPDRQLGTADFVIPYKLDKRGTSHIHHIAIFYLAERVPGRLEMKEFIPNNDSLGAEWADPGRLNEESCSPLVMQALAWLAGEADWPVEAVRLDGWQVIE